MVTKEKIDFKLSEIFRQITGIDFRENMDLKNQKLLGKSIGLTARELVHLYYMIEEQFGIEIGEEIILDGKFDIYNNILEATSKYVMNKSDKKGVS